MEGQSLADFFSNTDPFSLADSQPFGMGPDTKLAGTDFADWDFMAPATVHHVSATIPDQNHAHHHHQDHHQQHSHEHNQHQSQSHSHHQLQNHANTHQHGFPGDSIFTTHPLHLDPMATTHDDLQAASTLFAHAHQSPLSTSPMVATSHGLLNEQLAALLPNHAAPGSLDAQLAAQWAGSDAHIRIQQDFGPPLHRPSLKRTYTFGTDDSFSNPAAFSAPNHETEEQVTRRLMRDTRTLSYIGDVHAPELAAARPTTADDASADDDNSDETSSADDSQPSKKRKKSMQVKKESIRKTASSTRVTKSKKPASSIADGDSKKKRASAAASKLARENLSEEQKRSNHILSEQKRRNLIKRGFDDLHDLVPEIRNGGLSKSSVLTEAANFLDKLIADNLELMRLVSGKG